ncbi:Ig-like domain-containing protein [Pseudoalteromonas sp. SG45-5]|uniref:Ig-like domain-containing protein n=1 Tax=unclassified Pseudoalteromonas TaxID=194690 RepID=UPI0015FD5730|nr:MULTISPECIES: Ig-like domain-containing protein [unclassified Pseudoalteromonas]MBB1386710.1 Ig-like domain-containing protein [Pseudoalteromonas sp. SG45-5]MBB1394751.1 Ig-like domain-containing protein [Pseudoalteromonas sp. SG44-4]MBB1446960.1 Ig-like domain-containing protein [Pseudoalteromonas sp. SG41-6]
MTKINIFPKLSVVAILLTSIIGCGADDKSDDLIKAVTLEKLRSEGTIIESVTIENAQTRLRVGDKHQLSATGIDSKGKKRDVTKELTWSSSDSDIATVSDSGLVTAIANSSADQGLVKITGTTINDISGNGEISISNAAVASIKLKQASSQTGNINTCIDAKINGDVSYTDGYISLNTIKDMSFSVDNSTTATIDSDGTLFTSAPSIEKTQITASIGTVTAQLNVTSDPKNLESINLLVDDVATDTITLNVGDRMQLKAQANLSNTDSTFNIDNSISWSQLNTDDYVGITTDKNNKGVIFALKPGSTKLIGQCGGKQKIATLEVKGDASLNTIQINDGESTLTLEPLKTIDLVLTANYTTTPTSLNVTEFADWNLNGSSIVEGKLINAGTKEALYRLTSKSSTNNTAVISVTYDGIISNTTINIE